MDDLVCYFHLRIGLFVATSKGNVSVSLQLQNKRVVLILDIRIFETKGTSYLLKNILLTFAVLYIRFSLSLHSTHLLFANLTRRKKNEMTLS